MPASSRVRSFTFHEFVVEGSPERQAVGVIAQDDHGRIGPVVDIVPLHIAPAASKVGRRGGAPTDPPRARLHTLRTSPLLVRAI